MNYNYKQNEVGIKFGKNSKVGFDKYEWVELNDKEIKNIIDKTISINMEIWSSIPEEHDGKFIPKETIFDACSINTFTLLKNKLNKKIYEKQQKGFGKRDNNGNSSYQR